MYIIIVGLGGIGRCLVGQAVEHSNNVVAIDQDEARCSDILEHHDVLAITGNATFKEVGVRISENPDELVASRLYYWAENPQLQQLAQIPGGSIFEIVAENGATIVGHEIHELKVKDFVFIAIRRLSGELIIPSGNVTI